MTQPGHLQGRTAFVTGASRGIGKAIALALAEAGADIAFTFREQSAAANEVLRAIEGRGRRALAFRLDIRDRPALRSALAETAAALGPPGILINNAGINKPTDFDKISDADWDEILSVNLKGPFIAAQEALPFLAEAGSGSIVNIGSVSGQYGGPRTAHYAASKAGLICLSQVIARFGAARGIRSNTIAAGLIASEMASSGLASGAVQKAAEAILLKRLGEPAEVAAAAVFLSGPESSYITGQVINVNGGLYF